MTIKEMMHKMLDLNYGYVNYEEIEFKENVHNLIQYNFKYSLPGYGLNAEIEMDIFKDKITRIEVWKDDIKSIVRQYHQNLDEIYTLKNVRVIKKVLNDSERLLKKENQRIREALK